jgi:hypothetical protein
MLFFFNRLTFGLKQQHFVKILGIAVGVTYVAVFLTITLGCYPTQRNWQVVPYPGEVCTFKPQNFYVSTALNVVTDAALLAIPLPLMWALQVPLKKKIALCLLLSSGIFVISAAIIRIVMTLVSHPSALTINRWGVRETIAGIVAVNAPILKPGKSHLLVALHWTAAANKHEQCSQKPFGPRTSHLAAQISKASTQDRQTMVVARVEVNEAPASSPIFVGRLRHLRWWVRVLLTIMTTLLPTGRNSAVFILLLRWRVRAISTIRAPIDRARIWWCSVWTSLGRDLGRSRGGSG